MKKILRSAIPTILISLLVGCASTPSNSGYLSDYDQLQPGQHLEKYWADTSLTEKADSPQILLGDISVVLISDKNGVSTSDGAMWLKSGLESGGMISGDHQGAPLKIDVAITFLDPGSAAKRVWAGELGAGHAQVQIEGKVFDVASGNLLATFAERRSSSGVIGLKDIGGDAGPSLIEQMIKLVSDDINSELLLTFSSS